MFKTIKQKYRTFVEEKCVTESAQLIFVALVWMALFAILIGTQGCAPKPNNHEITPKPEPTYIPTPGTRRFRAVILQGEEPNDYKVDLDWDAEPRPETWYLKRGEKEHELHDLAMLAGDQLAFQDKDTEPGKKYHYLLGYTDKGDFIIQGRLSIDVPRDLIGTKILNKLDFNNVNRLFLRGNSMYCMRSNLTINVNEIIAENAALKYVGYLASDPVNTLTILTKKARGHLQLIAYGSSGHTGFRPAPYIPEGREPGNGAHSPRIHFETLGAEGFSVDVVRRPGEAGQWFQEPETPGGKSGEFRPFCVRQESQTFGDCSSFPVMLTKKEANNE